MPSIEHLQERLWEKASLAGLGHFMRIEVPASLVLYAMLGILDLGFSKMAFAAGYAEANPVFVNALNHGLFEINKVLLTLVVVVTAMALWQFKSVRRLMFVANLGMYALAVLHIFSLLRHVL